MEKKKFNVQLDEKLLDQLVQKELSLIDDALSQYIEKESNPCIIAAYKFLTSIQEALEEIIKANLLAKHAYQINQNIANAENLSDGEIENLVKEYNNSRNLFKELYQRTKIVEVNLKMNQFQKEINKILEQQVKLLYVSTGTKGKDPVVLQIDNLEEVISKGEASKGQGLKTKISVSRKEALNAIKGLNEHIKKFNQREYLTEKQLDNLKDTFNEVIQRFNEHKYIVKNKKSKNKNKTIHVILWRPEKDWKITIMGNQRGDLSQAYIAAIINREYFRSSNLEKNIDSFMSYVAEVDSERGILKGDVTEKLKKGSSQFKTIEYAVKMGNASFMSLQTAIDLAIEILTTKPPFNKKQLQKKKKEFGKNIKPRNQQIILSELQEAFDKNLPDNIKKLLFD